MSEDDPIILCGMKTLIDRQWEKNVNVYVKDKKIKMIVDKSKREAYSKYKTYEFPEDHYLLPGLIDCHVHGADGHDVMDGSVSAFDAISRALAREGVCSFLPTTMTASAKEIESVLEIIPKAMKETTGASILGLHLEGPFIAAEKKGAQMAKACLPPSQKLFSHWQKKAEGAIKLITLAPELTGSLSFIKQLRREGVVVSIGHTNASFAECEAAINAGCTHATHLFNAMRAIHQREPGASISLLLSDKVTTELIVDGLHLHEAMVSLAFKLKGKDKLILVSDAMRAKCLGDGKYDLGGQEVVVTHGKATLKDGTLAGSTLKLPEAIKNLVQFTGCTLTDAIQFASRNPAKLLNIFHKKGSIEIGKDADLVVMNKDLEVVLTLSQGREIYKGF
jgi:N-acetylglucosamine-6-phosphate deacetylase